MARAPGDHGQKKRVDVHFFLEFWLDRIWTAGGEDKYADNKKQKVPFECEGASTDF